MGSSELTSLSTNDCESFIEETIESVADIDFSDIMLISPMQSMAQYALEKLLCGKDATLPLWFDNQDLLIKEEEFWRWLEPRIDSAWSQTQHLLQSLAIATSQIDHLMLLGPLFQSENICLRLKKCFVGYGANPSITVQSQYADNWNMCYAALAMNNQVRPSTLII